MALSDVSLRCKAMSGLGATADIGRRNGLDGSVAFDPIRTLADCDASRFEDDLLAAWHRYQSAKRPYQPGQKARCSCWKPSVPAPKVRSCSEFASDLRDVAALKARARKFVL